MKLCVLVVLSSLFITLPVFAAGGQVTGKIDFIQIGLIDGEKEYVLIKLDNNIVDKPACADDSNERFALDLSTEYGKAVYSTLLAAKYSKSEVFIRGSNNCNFMGGGFETISLIRAF